MAPLSLPFGYDIHCHSLLRNSPVQSVSEDRVAGGSKINWSLGDPKLLAFSGGVDWSSVVPIKTKRSQAEASNPLIPIDNEQLVDDTDARGYSGFFYEGYEGILSKPYPTKGVKSFEEYLDKDHLMAVIAGGARVNDKEVQDIIAPATEQLAKTSNLYEKDQIMNMIWGAIMEGLLRGDRDGTKKQMLADRRNRKAEVLTPIQE
jgi:predicted DNA-binding protein YlxM (UPF0122 family)